MFNFGGMEIVVILVVALVVLGPDKLPKFMRSVGRGLGELRRASTEFQRTLNTDLDTPEIHGSQRMAPEEAAASAERSAATAAAAPEASQEASPPPAPREDQTAEAARRRAARPMPHGRSGSVKPRLRKKTSVTSDKDTPEQA